MHQYHIQLDPINFSLENVGKGQYIPLTGHPEHKSERLADLKIVTEDIQTTVNYKSEICCVHNNNTRLNGFRALIPIHEPLHSSQLFLGLSGKLKNGELIEEQHAIELEPSSSLDSEVFQSECLNTAHFTSMADKPLVAICMATYEPDEQAFVRQIETIKNQSYENWLCIVRDDASSQAKRELVSRICAEDERFIFVQGHKNINFYANFEAALYCIPEHVDYVALADQDDIWYPNKLETLLGCMQDEVELVYSDMRIVDDEIGFVSDSYWRSRRNEFRDMSVVLLANTVTGAASLFKRSLLDEALPFPKRVGDAFHDHWIACVALAKGRIEYVDKPLYDYIQHGQSVIGHCDHTHSPWKTKIALLSRSVMKKRTLSAIKNAVVHLRNASLGVYEYECRRLELIAATLELRGLNSRHSLAACKLFSGRVMPIFRLSWVHLKVRWQGHTTDDAEVRLALGYLFKLIDDVRFSVFRRRK